MSGLLVTGTDTGVGKTVVACGLAADLARRARRIAVWKPVETGWDPAASSTTDAARLARAAGGDEPLELVCPYRLRAPVAPAVAARLEGMTIGLDDLSRHYRRRRIGHELVIVEGAGGLLAPLAPRITYLDLAGALDLAVLIVAANRLGVVNHAALTARVARDAGLHVVGFVLNDVPRPETEFAADASLETNRASILELTGLPCLGHVPLLPVADTAGEVARHLEVGEILQALGLHPDSAGA
jgi:dethiobiotin synthetase